VQAYIAAMPGLERAVGRRQGRQVELALPWRRGPGRSKHKDVRYFDFQQEDEPLDQARVAA